MRKALCSSLTLTLSIGLCCLTALSQTPETKLVVAPPPEVARINALLERLGERARKSYEHFAYVTWTESWRFQELKPDLKPRGPAKEAVYDAITGRRAAPDNPKVITPYAIRELKVLNGKPTKGYDDSEMKYWAVEDPRQEYQYPLAFLFAEQRKDWLFTFAGEEPLDGRPTVVLDVSPAVVTPTEIKVERNKFSVDHLPRRGKLWLDAATETPLQLQWELADKPATTAKRFIGVYGPVVVWRTSRKLSYEKWDTLLRFQAVAFNHPAQTLLLPVSSETVWLVKGTNKPAWRSTTTYGNYKRFAGNAKASN